MVAISLDPFWRSEPIDGLPGPDADDSMADVSGEIIWMDLLPDDFYVYHNHGCSAGYLLGGSFYKFISGKVKGEALVGNTLMILVAIFLVIAAIILASGRVEGFWPL